MNFTTKTLSLSVKEARKSSRHMTRMAAWSVMAGMVLGTPGLAADGPAIPSPSAKPIAPDAIAAAPLSPMPNTTQAAETRPSEPKVLTPRNYQPPADSATQPAGEKADLVKSGLGEDGTIHLMVNKTAVVSTKNPYKRVQVVQPDVADIYINQGSTNEILVLAKHPGSTQLILWDGPDGSERSQVIDVIVSFDLRGLESQIKQMFPRGSIKAESANGTIVLRGHVPDLNTATQVAAIAAPYGTDPKAGVLNFLEVSGGQQVVLQVRFAEVTRSVNQSLGFNAFVTDGKFSLGAGNGTFGATPTLANAGSNASFPLYGGAQAGNASFEYFVSALRTNGLLRILAEPNLTAISGQQASFLAGGEIPILVPQASGGGSVTTVEYKQYGIQLNFTPTVLGDGRIRLQCTPQVSDLDYAHAVALGGSLVPALTTRNVNTTVELADGQTFALAGLLRTDVNANRNVTPLLGDIPILGALFRSISYNRQETELVVMVTPHMVEALNPNQVPRLPGEVWRHPTEAQLFLNGDMGGPAPDMRNAPNVRVGHFYGTSGFNPPAPASK